MQRPSTSPLPARRGDSFGPRMGSLLRFPLMPHWSTIAILGLAVLSSSCASGKNARGLSEEGETREFVPLPMHASQVGELMLELDKTLKAWQQAVVSGNAVMTRRMELILRNETNDSFEEVVEGLESPAPALRQTAAAALGFSGREEALSPLSNALSDPDATVLANALIGMGQLADPRSPLSIIAYHLRNSEDSLVRSNAAFALGRIVSNGGGDEEVVREACRQGLYDDFAGVRSQCASVLGALRDSESVPDLASLLEDPEDLAAKPAILALGEIGRAHPRSLGETARALVDAMGNVKRGRRNWIRAELVRLSERDFEQDLSAWREWAYSLP